MVNFRRSSGQLSLVRRKGTSRCQWEARARIFQRYSVKNKTPYCDPFPWRAPQCGLQLGAFALPRTVGLEARGRPGHTEKRILISRPLDVPAAQLVERDGFGATRHDGHLTMASSSSSTAFFCVCCRPRLISYRARKNLQRTACRPPWRRNLPRRRAGWCESRAAPMKARWRAPCKVAISS